MAKSTTYFLKTGNADKKRLSIINQLYNPFAIHFMRQAGLRTGMKVLEIGSGTGHMAVEMAKIVGKKGTVMASDISPAQLKIAQKTAKDANCHNIEFLQLDINEDLNHLYNQFDFIYGRWTLEFSKDSKKSVQQLYACLKPGGIFTYEGVDVSDREYFCYPKSSAVMKWFSLILKNWKSNKMHIQFVKWLYAYFQNIHAKDLKIACNQVMLTTSEEKSILRLGLMSVKEAYLKKKFLTPKEYQQLLDDLSEIEKSDAIIGYVRNILVAAKKSR